MQLYCKLYFANRDWLLLEQRQNEDLKELLYKETCTEVVCTKDNTKGQLLMKIQCAELVPNSI